MIDNLRDIGILDEGVERDPATGGVYRETMRNIEDKNVDTWVAYVVIESPLGVYGRGATEGHALAALECKLKALGNMCTAAFAEAESGYKARKAAEGKEMADRLIKALGGGGLGLGGLDDKGDRGPDKN